MGYLDDFRTALDQRWKGHLVRVHEAATIEPRAKEYMAALARRGMIERVTWGWYWIPGANKDFLTFLAKEQHVVVVHKQTAAALWNGDFVHRDTYRVAVADASYARALGSFCQSRGWPVVVETRTFQDGEYGKIGNVYVAGLEETIVDCVKEWAFADAFAALYDNYKAIAWDKIAMHDWERIPRTNTRIGQVVKYGTAMMGREMGDDRFRETRARITDGFVRRQVEEAVQQVAEHG